MQFSVFGVLAHTESGPLAQALAGLVIATSHFDSGLANEHFARLELMSPAMQEDDEMLDAEALERAVRSPTVAQHMRCSACTLRSPTSLRGLRVN